MVKEEINEKSFPSLLREWISPAGAVVVVKRRGFNDLRYILPERERERRPFPAYGRESQRGAGAVNAVGVTMATNKSHGPTNDNNTRHTITGRVAQAYCLISLTS